MWDDSLLVSAVGLFWYWIALNLNRWSQKRTVYNFPGRLARVAWDLLVVAFGSLLGLIAVANEVIFFRRDYSFGASFTAPGFAVGAVLEPACWLAWFVLLAVPFGRDAVRALTRPAA